MGIFSGFYVFFDVRVLYAFFSAFAWVLCVFLCVCVYFRFFSLCSAWVFQGPENGSPKPEEE